MFGDFLNKIKDYGQKVGELENSVSDEHKKFVEVFERNLMLEKEISDRTRELDNANKSILTLKHIWETMNSSEPISEVLQTIVKALSQDLGYAHSIIFQFRKGEKGNYLQARLSAQNEYSVKVNDLLEKPLGIIEVPVKAQESVLIASLMANKIIKPHKFSDLFKGAQPCINQNILYEMDKIFTKKAIAIVPIYSENEWFGCLVTFSSRDDITETEKNFLSMFIKQIEVAITIAHLFETIREQAITDSLTGVYNRRYFDECLAKEAERANRLEQPFSLITLDLDNLKVINDNYGHGAGDAAICSLSNVLKQNARSIDIPARFGGEEFGIVLPGIDSEKAMIVAERLRAEIEKSPIKEAGIVTASIGVATFLEHTKELDELLELADQAMYKAKRAGRNQVCIANKQEKSSWLEIALDAFIEILEKHELPTQNASNEELLKGLKKIDINKTGAADKIYKTVDKIVKSYDPLYQVGFTKDKIYLATRLGQKIKLEEEDLDKLRLAVLLYDIGNIMMPESILLKPGPLSKVERNKILEHPIIAAKQILKPIHTLEGIIPLVEHHHENWDGSGYPNKLIGKEIPEMSRILVIIDAYFALINDRAYRKAYTKKEAVKILRKGANDKWDGTLIDMFTKIIEDLEK